jgi:serine phosphatase RsbU (regulator of sigma subunit)
VARRRGGRRRTASRWRALLAALLGLALSVALAIIDGVVTPRAIGVLGLLAAVPLVVAPIGSLTGSVIAGVLAAAAVALMSDYDHAFGSRTSIAILIGVAFATVWAASMSAMRRQRLRRLRRVESVADVVQQTLLRPVPSTLEGITIATRYASATRGAQVGGDVYEVLVTPYGLRIFLGDVRGKGLAALHLANTAAGAFREWGYQLRHLADLATQLDASVARNADPEGFVTGVIVQVVEDGIELVNCGHPPPVLIGDDALSLVEPAHPSLPLGLGVTPETLRVAFGPGDRLLLYTDGVSDARRRTRFFDLAAEVAAVRDRAPQELVDALHKRLVKFARRRLDDDVAMLLLERGDVRRPVVLDLLADQPDPAPTCQGHTSL